MSQTIYHGSNAVVEHPDIRIRGYEKDFGYGFYCTSIERQARKWALTKKEHLVSGVISREAFWVLVKFR